MFVTPLNFTQVLERFYHQDKYDLMLLFASSFDGNDRTIIHEIVDNAKRIDRITGDRICFFYFIKDSYDNMNESLVNWMKEYIDIVPFERDEYLYVDKFHVTKDTANDICRNLAIPYSDLPAFILVNKDRREEPQILSIHDYNDFERFLTPLNILYSFIVDKDAIKQNTIEKLNNVLESYEGGDIIEQRFLCGNEFYSDVVLKIWKNVRRRCVKSLDSISELIRYEFNTQRVNVFISCKSQDYGLIHELYYYLIVHGFKPFVADASIKGAEIADYSVFIGKIINIFQYMIVFATDVSYLETPYVSAEWHTFINNINARQPLNPQIACILPRYIDIHSLPTLLRDKQCFTTENYKDSLMSFFYNDSERIGKLTEDELNKYLKLFPGAHNEGGCKRTDFLKEFHNRIINREKYALLNPQVSFLPSHNALTNSNREQTTSYSSVSFWDKLFGIKTYELYSSIFAPAEIKRQSHMLVQVYLHLFEETEKVTALAQESQWDAERRDYIPLQCKLKKGDNVDVLLNIYGETLLMSEKKSIVWQGIFTKCSFDYFVPKYIDIDDLSCMALLTVNGTPIGEMRFITRIVESPRKLNSEVFAHKYKKVFISYAHQDESKVKFLAEGFKAMNADYFFDRHYLKTGDVFPQEIQNYINKADLFILCWSKNASKSEYVEKERMQALERAFPQIKPQHAAKLSIYPMSIEPRADLPNDMKDNYHFGEI